MNKLKTIACDVLVREDLDLNVYELHSVMYGTGVDLDYILGTISTRSKVNQSGDVYAVLYWCAGFGNYTDADELPFTPTEIKDFERYYERIDAMDFFTKVIDD